MIGIEADKLFSLPMRKNRLNLEDVHRHRPSGLPYNLRDPDTELPMTYTTVQSIATKALLHVYTVFAVVGPTAKFEVRYALRVFYSSCRPMPYFNVFRFSIGLRKQR